MRPETIRAGGDGTRPRMLLAVTDFPHPVSPTMPSDSPAARSKLTPSIARYTPSNVSNSRRRSRTESSGGGGLPGVRTSHRPSSRGRRGAAAASLPNLPGLPNLPDIPDRPDLWGHPDRETRQAQPVPHRHGPGGYGPRPPPRPRLRTGRCSRRKAGEIRGPALPRPITPGAAGRGRRGARRPAG